MRAHAGTGTSGSPQNRLQAACLLGPSGPLDSRRARTLLGSGTWDCVPVSLASPGKARAGDQHTGPGSLNQELGGPRESRGPGSMN